MRFWISCRRFFFDAQQRKLFHSPAERRDLEDRYAAILRKCSGVSELIRVHNEIAGAGLVGNRYISNVLVQMYGCFGCVENARAAFEGIFRRNAHSWNFMVVAYAQNGHLEEARKVFEKLPGKNDITWNTMITGYVQNGCLEEARALFDELPLKDVIAKNIMVTAYAQSGDLQQAKRMFDTIPASDLTVVCWNNILSGYAQNGLLQEAKAIFDAMMERNEASWNGMMAAYIQQQDFERALRLFRVMNLDGSKPNRITFTAVSEACAGLGDVVEARALLSCMTEESEHVDAMVGNVLMSMFTKFGSVEEAKLVYDRISEKNSIANTSMMSAYAQDGRIDEARLIFVDMDQRDVVSWTTMVAAYLNNSQFEESEKLFHLMPSRDALAWSTMVMGYALNGSVEKARSLHEEMPCREVISWTALITGHARAGYAKEAVELLKLMDLEGVEADKVTYVSVLEACASCTALIEGRSIYENAVSLAYDKDTIVGTALINVFGKCGRVQEARKVFDYLPEPNVVSWTSIIVSYARNGRGSLATEMFSYMDLKGEEPNWITFSTILAACNHGGLLEDGRNYFLRMIGDHFIAPVVEHYRCLVDLLGRSGQLDRMEDLITNMPFKGDEIAWTAVLGACSLHGDTERGARLAKQVMSLELDRVSSLYVLLANIYTTGQSQ